MNIGDIIAGLIKGLAEALKAIFGREEPEKHETVITPDESPVRTTADDLRSKLDELKRLRRDRAENEDRSADR